MLVLAPDAVGTTLCNCLYIRRPITIAAAAYQSWVHAAMPGVSSCKFGAALQHTITQRIAERSRAMPSSSFSLDVARHQMWRRGGGPGTAPSPLLPRLKGWIRPGLQRDSIRTSTAQQQCISRNRTGLQHRVTSAHWRFCRHVQQREWLCLLRMDTCNRPRSYQQLRLCRQCWPMC